MINNELKLGNFFNLLARQRVCSFQLGWQMYYLGSGWGLW